MATPADLQALMAARGWSTARASEEFCVVPRTVQRWLAGDRRIPGYVVRIIAKRNKANRVGKDNRNG